MKFIFPLNLLSMIILMGFGVLLQLNPYLRQCLDWPICRVGTSSIEFIHRFLAMIVLIFTVIQTNQWWKKVKNVSVLWPLIFIILQIILGGISFLHKVPVLESTLHLILSLFFLVFLTHFSISFETKLQSEKKIWDFKIKDWAFWVTAFWMFQVISGGWWKKAGGIFECHEAIDWWTCWIGAIKQPELKSWLWFHRIWGVFLYFFSLASLFQFSKVFKHRSLLGLSFILMTSQLLSGLFMGRWLEGSQLTFFHFMLAILNLIIFQSISSWLRSQEKALFGKLSPTFLQDLLELFKPKLTILVVITVLVGVFLATQPIKPFILLIGMFGIWLQAAGSLCLNCYYERDLDKLMTRTMNRPLPGGRVQPRLAFILGFSVALLGTLILFLWVNALTAILGLIAFIFYLYFYTPLKLYSPYALYVGAVPGALPTLMGFTMVEGHIGLYGLYLFLFLFCWQIPHFMAISIYRKNDYQNAQLVTFAQTHSQKFLKLNIFFYTLLLGLIGILPYFLGLRSLAFLIISLILSFLMLILSLWGYGVREELKFNQWARHYFWGTIFYLPLQLGFLLILH